MCLFAPMAALAVQPNEVLADPRLEARARALSMELRCLVCQNQSIDDSNAPLARDLRLMVRERLTAGDSDAEVMRYIVARYGDFVLLRPPLKPETIALWAAPGVLLLLGAGFLVLAARRRAAGAPEPAAAPLSDAEKARLAQVLDRREEV
jgi:cytochrome c-type biogenesis protein CcmH